MPFSALTTGVDAGYITDESSFYGSDDEKARLQSRVSDASVSKYFSSASSLTTLAMRNLAAEAKRVTEPSQLHNPYEAETSAWQIEEPVAAFLSRLSPETSSIVEHGPWIWVANPHVPRPETLPKTGEFTAFSRNILEPLTQKREELEAKESDPDKASTKAAITKKLKPLREEAEAALLAAAEKFGVISGKWMLFPLLEDLNRVWKAVVEGTIVGDLGTAAKVATDQGDDRAGRLICVYTRDWKDKADVKRVLVALNERGLKPMSYKCDAWTYADIKTGNVWKIKPSMYVSREILAETK